MTWKWYPRSERSWFGAGGADNPGLLGNLHLRERGVSEDRPSPLASTLIGLLIRPQVVLSAADIEPGEPPAIWSRPERTEHHVLSNPVCGENVSEPDITGRAAALLVL
jgi:hypothetical protein